MASVGSVAAPRDIDVHESHKLILLVDLHGQMFDREIESLTDRLHRLYPERPILNIAAGGGAPIALPLENLLHRDWFVSHLVVFSDTPTRIPRTRLATAFAPLRERWMENTRVLFEVDHYLGIREEFIRRELQALAIGLDLESGWIFGLSDTFVVPRRPVAFWPPGNRWPPAANYIHWMNSLLLTAANKVWREVGSTNRGYLARVERFRVQSIFQQRFERFRQSMLWAYPPDDPSCKAKLIWESESEPVFLDQW
jgi:hypothetical protein